VEAGKRVLEDHTHLTAEEGPAFPSRHPEQVTTSEQGRPLDPGAGSEAKDRLSSQGLPRPRLTNDPKRPAALSDKRHASHGLGDPVGSVKTDPEVVNLEEGHPRSVPWQRDVMAPSALAAT
jgi:hypothetical protein